MRFYNNVCKAPINTLSLSSKCLGREVKEALTALNSLDRPFRERFKEASGLRGWGVGGWPGTAVWMEDRAHVVLSLSTSGVWTAMWRWPANGRRIWRVWGCHLFIQVIHSVHVWTGLLLHCADLGKTAWGGGDLVPDQRAEGTGGTTPVRMGRAGGGEGLTGRLPEGMLCEGAG